MSKPLDDDPNEFAMPPGWNEEEELRKLHPERLYSVNPYEPPPSDAWMIRPMDELNDGLTPTKVWLGPVVVETFRFIGRSFTALSLACLTLLAAISVLMIAFFIVTYRITTDENPYRDFFPLALFFMMMTTEIFGVTFLWRWILVSARTRNHRWQNGLVSLPTVVRIGIWWIIMGFLSLLMPILGILVIVYWLNFLQGNPLPFLIPALFIGAGLFFALAYNLVQISFIPAFLLDRERSLLASCHFSGRFIVGNRIIWLLSLAILVFPGIIMAVFLPSAFEAASSMGWRIRQVVTTEIFLVVFHFVVLPIALSLHAIFYLIMTGQFASSPRHLPSNNQRQTAKEPEIEKNVQGKTEGED